MCESVKKMKLEIIIEEARCTKCGAIYDSIIYKMKEKCAIPRRKAFGSKDSGYCDGKLELIKGKYQLVRKL